jgi:large subunit ribosomal protein L19
MSQIILKEVSAEQIRTDRNHFKVGDEVSVSIRVREGDKERIQIFTGIVISRKGSGISETFTVRRVDSGYGMERVFPLHSPVIEKIRVTKESIVLRAAKMYYLRRRIGKEASKVKEKRLVISQKNV